MLWQGRPSGYGQAQVIPTLPDQQELGAVFKHFFATIQKAKIDDFQVLDMLYKKLSDELKDRLITVKEAENLNNLILLFYEIDANMKKISKQLQLCTKPNASNFPAIKPLFKLYNSAPIKLSTTVGVAVVSPVPSIATETYLGPMDMSIVMKQGPIS